jgi:signal transduction histidine kinase
MPSAPDLPELEVHAAQVANVHGQIPLAVAVTVVNAVLLALVLDGGATDATEIAWLGATLAICAIRLIVWWAQRRDPKAAERPGRWGAWSAATTILAGLAWGLGAVLLWPASETAQLFWVFVVGGMCTGAAALHYAHLPTAFGFLLPASLPIAAHFAFEGTGRGLGAAAMILVFLLALLLVASRSHAQFRALALARRDLRRQQTELADARDRLHQEVEEHRATAASLHQAQKLEALGQLTGGIAHDFNNLLMAVLGSLALLRKRLPAEDARALRLLDNAVQGANRGAALTQRLLAFARRQTLRPEVVALPALLDGMTELLQRSIGPGHRLRLDVSAELPPVSVDPGQLELTVLNLALNARDAMPGGGEIRISTRREEVTSAVHGLAPGGYVVLGIADEGEGMDDATLARAAEPFFTTKGPGKGTGLGLSMAYGLAAQSGGRLVLNSRRGAGTTAEVWLPQAAGSPAAADPAEAAVPRPSRRLRVLLVDDDPLVLASTAGMLEEIGHAVVPAEGGEQALAWLRDDPAIDVVVTDFGMPGMTGLDLAEAARAMRPVLPLVLTTGYGDTPEPAPGGVTVLRKPFGQEVLGAAIEESLAAAG